MSNLYINTVEIIGGILTPVAVVLLLILTNNSIKSLTERKKERTQQLKLRPGFKVRIHDVPNPTMWGVEISKDGEVLEDVGVDKL